MSQASLIFDGLIFDPDRLWRRNVLAGASVAGWDEVCRRVDLTGVGWGLAGMGAGEVRGVMA